MPDYVCQLILLPQDENEPLGFLPENIGLGTQQSVTGSYWNKGKLEYNPFVAGT